MFFQKNTAKYSVSPITTLSSECAWKKEFSIQLARQDVFTSITVAELQNLHSFSDGRGLTVTLKKASLEGNDASIDLTFKSGPKKFNLEEFEKNVQEQIQKQPPSNDADLLNMICETANQYSRETEYGEKKEILLKQLREKIPPLPAQPRKDFLLTDVQVFCVH